MNVFGSFGIGRNILLFTSRALCVVGLRLYFVHLLRDTAVVGNMHNRIGKPRAI